MTIEISRRLMLAGAGAGSALAFAGTGRTAFAATGSTPDFGPEAADVFGPPAGIAQLSRNENPFGPAPSAIQAIAQNASKGAYYADRGLRKMLDMVAERYSLGVENVVLSSGSTEVLICAAMALPEDKAILCPDLFWDTTVKYAARKGAKVKRVPLGADMAVDLTAMKAAIGPDVGLVHICNPNNPTAMSLDGDALRAFIRSIDPAIPVLIDEAYMELTARPEYTSMVDLLAERENLIITRTFSKIYGMAGLRLGYALTSPAIAETLRGYLMSFGGNTAGLAAGIASYNDAAFLRYSKSHIVEAREAIMEAITSCGLTALPSDTNFVYVKVPDADALFSAMAEARVDIRPAYGKWKQWSRVSTGKMEDVQRYAKVLRAFYGA
ncbi:pyridoxal phosphate-dependent aminotransferase [Novosphingobium mangrovi (ex Huang et al. 2023)]|uniref:Aminotransferase class I/II-fold pyridoxal phosphate-dependent enzyme n=1 Tax=Novosphingobium mangrovi (ex Huang et al. 2023) TaxID=2976432 RepID=A0ABT2I7Y6_9SPHN|nr:histidinol-phosphate transaminase [Novosphingobium mangrovi (ex Huang et al. 2023)]MCT2400937.1 aminotransferase class I/II-fold pyridoxal phosphate-dependent enzyme [Novosphingobium mangrovi (ex Huang et al. 2023)]